MGILKQFVTEAGWVRKAKKLVPITLLVVYGIEILTSPLQEFCFCP